MPSTTDTGLNQRKTTGGEAKAPRTLNDNKELMARSLIKNLPSWVPDGVKTHLDTAFGYVWPVLIAIGNLIDVLSPYVPIVMQKYEQFRKVIAPWKPELAVGMLAGLIFIFFGGYFVLTIAAFEAFRLAGWDSFADSLQKLCANYRKFRAGNEADDKRDDDGDGIDDVLQISTKNLITRKIGVFMSHTDPIVMSQCLQSIYSGSIGVLATLKIQFAKTITLGATIGECIEKPVCGILGPILRRIVPTEYHKWVQVGMEYICKSIGCSIAWLLQRIISAVHAAIRGSYMFTHAFAKWTSAHGYKGLSEGYYDEVFAALCSIMGLYIQISSMFSLPWILSFILFPLICLEFFIQQCVNFM